MKLKHSLTALTAIQLISTCTAAPYLEERGGVCSNGVYGELVPILSGYPIAVAFCKAVYPVKCASNPQKRGTITTSTKASTSPKTTKSTTSTKITSSKTTTSATKLGATDAKVSAWSKCQQQPGQVISTICSCLQTCKATASSTTTSVKPTTTSSTTSSTSSSTTSSTTSSTSSSTSSSSTTSSSTPSPTSCSQLNTQGSTYSSNGRTFDLHCDTGVDGYQEITTVGSFDFPDCIRQCAAYTDPSSGAKTCKIAALLRNYPANYNCILISSYEASPPGTSVDIAIEQGTVTTT